MGRLILTGVVVLSAFIGGICFMAQRAVTEIISGGNAYNYGFSRGALEGWATVDNTRPVNIMSISIGDKGCVVLTQRPLTPVEEQRMDALLINVGCQKGVD